LYFILGRELKKNTDNNEWRGNVLWYFYYTVMSYFFAYFHIGT
jgi:hypothetical protein